MIEDNPHSYAMRGHAAAMRNAYADIYWKAFPVQLFVLGYTEEIFKEKYRNGDPVLEVQIAPLREWRIEQIRLKRANPITLDERNTYGRNG